MEIEYTGASSNLDIEQIEFNAEGYSIDALFMSVPGLGFGNVAAKYASPFASKIRLNSKVTEVNSETDDDTTAVTFVEDGKTKLVKAKTVLVTVSLGVLKAGTINFVPSLPEEKQRAIDVMGFGLLNRCTLTWKDDDALVWPEDELWFLLMTPEDETSGLWTTFYNPSKFKGEPTITAWIGGDEAVEAEKKSDDEIVADVMDNLRSMFPEISEPDRRIVVRWGRDENVRGAYSHPVPGRDFYDDASDLQRTFGRVFFAGEATGSGWATTMGAWNTGEKAAEGMIEMLASM